MPERLDRVLVSTHSGVVEIPWRSRDELLARVRHFESARGICKAFDGAGASAPVKLTATDEGLLHSWIDEWAREVGGNDSLPDGIWSLRKAIVYGFTD